MKERRKKVAKGKKILWIGIYFLFGFVLALKAEAAPLITAKNGILYQDSKPCFLVGVWSPVGYDDANIAIPYNAHKGYVEPVAGKEGDGLKINFEQTDRPCSRWIYTGFFPPDWAEKKYKCLKFWVKGDGSKITLVLRIGHWMESEKRESFSAHLGKFSLEDAEWKEITIPLEDKYDQLKKANNFSMGCGATNQAFSFFIDQITAIGTNGEEILCDFDGHGVTTSRIWSKWRERDEFKDDPVYKALRDDPLYQEISRKNFEAIGMNTCHLAEMNVAEPGIIAKGKRPIGSFGEIVFCEKMDGMPIVPGFVFASGAYNGGKEAEEWIKAWHLPPSILQRYPNGTAAGGFGAICFEDPLGSKVAQTIWQCKARHLLSHGANIYAYELINENSGFYLCGCPHNQETFISRLKEKYRDIETLNKDWGTSYVSFEEIHKQIPKLGEGENKIKGLTVAWNKFLEDRYVEILQQGGKWIHEVEDELGKPHALMGQMGGGSSGSCWEFLGFGGADMYKMAKGLDTIQTEGGVKFGSGRYSGEVNPLTAVMASKGGYDWQMHRDLLDAACPDKPIINTEHYLARYKDNIEPVSKADIITSLWEEFIRGASAVHTYWWGVSYAGREEALADGGNRSLLSPYLYPRESLNGYKEVWEEIGRVADVVMKRPRLGRNAELAVLFSRPTARYLVGCAYWFGDLKKETPFYRSHETFYPYFFENHYPMRYIYEEQLAEGKAVKYRVLFVPHSDNIYPDTMKYLDKYVNNGGTLVCFGDSFRYDEYGNEKEKERSYLLGLERIKTNSFTEEVELKDFGKVKVTTERKIMPSTAQVILTFPGSKEPFITLNKIGKGSVYYINADTFNLDRSLIDPLLDYLCRKVNLNPPVMVCDPEGNREPAIEADLIPGEKDRTVLFLVNWRPYQDRVVRISLPRLDEREKYYLADVAGDHLYTRDGKETLTGKELREGIYLLLPAEERVVLLLTGEKHPAMQKSVELFQKMISLLKGEKRPMANKPVELLSESAARELNDKIKARSKAEFEKEAVEANRKRKVVFGMIGKGEPEQITECIKSAADDTVEEIVLKLNDSTSYIAVRYGLQQGEDSVLTYLLAFKETTKDEDKEKILTKVLNALINKYGNKLKIISGWKEADILKAREYKATGACLPLDLRKQANMGFKDEKAGDQKGGLFDEGRSLKGLPAGSNIFAGIVFDIIDPEKNNDLACVVLRGKAKPYFQEKAEEILVGRKARNIYLLHGACYCVRDSQEVVYRLKFNYADNTDACADIKAGSEIADWFGKGGILTGARLAWVGKAIEKTGNVGEAKEWNVCLYCAKIANPNPEKEIRTLDLLSDGGVAVPAILAITAEENR